MSEQKKVVLSTRSKTGRDGAALTQVTEDRAAVTIAIPSGKGGILRWVSASYINVAETVVNAGGVISLENTSSDWRPFYFPIGTQTVVTEGGDALKPFVMHCSKKLPGNSSVTVNFIPYDNQSQLLEITLGWDLTSENPDRVTFSDVVHPLKADAVTATTRAAVVTSWAHNAADVIPIPGHKGGRLEAVILQPMGTLETVVVGGGLVEMFVDGVDIGPAEFYTTMMTAVGASGASFYNPMVIPFSHEVKANANYNFFYTPRNDQSQTVTCGLKWSRPYELVD